MSQTLKSSVGAMVASAVSQPANHVAIASCAPTLLLNGKATLISAFSNARLSSERNATAVCAVKPAHQPVSSVNYMTWHT